jgi:CRP/FNR family transcriptional regulator, cyclic AMP receptor protein
MTINIFNNDPHAERFTAGQTVFHEGDRGDHMFAVVKGTVEISIGGKAVETVEAGGVFGEMALVEEQPRVATALVKTDAELVRIDRKRFLFLVQQTPFFALQLMGIMAKRLRQMNQRL